LRQQTGYRSLLLFRLLWDQWLMLHTRRLPWRCMRTTVRQVHCRKLLILKRAETLTVDTSVWNTSLSIHWNTSLWQSLPLQISMKQPFQIMLFQAAKQQCKK
jgi:hypothetical protein